MDKTLSHFWHSFVTPIAYLAVLSGAVAYFACDPVFRWYCGIFNTLLGVLYAGINPAHKRVEHYLIVARKLRTIVRSDVPGFSDRADRREADFLARSLKEIRPTLWLMRGIGMVISGSGIALTTVFGRLPEWLVSLRSIVGAF